MKIEITDNSGKALEEMERAVRTALTKCGMTAEGYAKKLCPVDTGNLRNSITYMVSSNEEAVYVGTNSEYGVYVECGTGKYYPGGRQTPWVYQDAHGNWHLTCGQRAQPFVKPAVADHTAQYRQMIEDTLKNG